MKFQNFDLLYLCLYVCVCVCVGGQEKRPVETGDVSVC